MGSGEHVRNIVFFQHPGFDYLTSQIVEGFYLLEQENVITLHTNLANTHHGAKVKDLHTYGSEEELIDACGIADLIIFSSAGNMVGYDDYSRKVMSDPQYKNKRVFLDGHDGSGFLVNPDDYLIYFKREMRYPEVMTSGKLNMRSITFGIYQYLLDAIDFDSESLSDDFDRRDVDISFMAFGGSSPQRTNCVEFLDAFAKSSKRNTGYSMNMEVHVSGDSQPIPQDRYHEILYRSKVGFSCIGAGLDTLRFWETPAHGAVLASFDVVSRFVMRNAFEPFRHCVYFTEWAACAERVHKIVTNKDLWMQMRRSTDKILQLHSTKHRAQEILDACEEMS